MEKKEAKGIKGIPLSGGSSFIEYECERLQKEKAVSLRFSSALSFRLWVRKKKIIKQKARHKYLAIVEGNKDIT